MSKPLTMVLRYTMAIAMLSGVLLGSGRAEAQFEHITARRTEQALTSDFDRMARRWKLLESLAAGWPPADEKASQQWIANADIVRQQVEDIDKAAQYDRYMTLTYLESLGTDQIGPLQAAVKRYFLAEVAYFHACEGAEQSSKDSFKYNHIPEAERYRTEDDRRNGQAQLDSLNGVVQNQQELLRVAAEAGLKLDPVWSPERQERLTKEYKAMIDPPQGYWR